MNRRDFLKLTALAPILVHSGLSIASPSDGARTLLLVELNGGNDGLNTVVPFSDDRYYAARPTLAWPRGRLIELNDDLGLAPQLTPLMDVWDSGDLGVVLGVGYPDPNRSHFRSIEIWDTGSASDEYLSDGWIARSVGRSDFGDAPAEGVVFGDGDLGPLHGGDLRALVMDDPSNFVAQALNLDIAATPTDPSSSALAHIVGVQNDVVAAGVNLERQLLSLPSLPVTFASNPFAQQLSSAATLLAAGVAVGVMKVTLGSFDTHAGQQNPHQNLLTQLAGGLADFSQCCRALGIWDQVLVMTYSEFGRRVEENGSGGTDHGTAAPHFVLGGRVSGGMHGRQPDLADLDDGDLRHQVDYRSLYRTVLERWWELDAGELEGFDDVGFLG